MRLEKPLLAEFLGTFALIFIGAGAVIVLPPGQIAAVALAHGLVIMSFAYAFGNESGSYINPALLVAAVVAGEHSVLDAIPVMAAQLLGGVAGGLMLLAIYGHGAPHHFGMTTVDLHMTTLAGGLLLEAIGTFFLANAVLNTAIRGTAGRFAPFAIGMTLSFCIMAFGPVSGAGLNPARTLGPAVAAGNYSEVLLYMAAQFAGAIVAAVLYRLVWKKAGHVKSEKSELRVSAQKAA